MSDDQRKRDDLERMRKAGPLNALLADMVEEIEAKRDHRAPDGPHQPDSLDAAWAEAEAAAEAMGRVVYGIHRKATGWWAGATSGSSVQKLSVLVTDGAFADTPAAALRALAAKLREPHEDAD